MRARADAILVGIGTAEADDPLLTVRLPGLEGRSPVRVVLDGDLRIQPDSRLVKTAEEHPTWIVCGADPPPIRAATVAAAGAIVISTARGPGGRLDLREALRALAEHGLTHIFCEGGPTLADALAAADLVDEVALLSGPVPLGRTGVAAIGPALADALARRLVPCGGEQTLGPDRLQIFERRAS